MLHDFFDFEGHGAQHEFGRAHDERTRFLERDRRELALGRKGDHRFRFERARSAETVVERDRRLVVVVGSGEEIAHDLVERKLGVIVEDHKVVYRHSAVGDRPRFIEAEHVDAREHFKGIEILYQGMFFGEPPYADRHGKRSEEQQARGDHPNDDRAGQLNGFGNIVSRCR